MITVDFEKLDIQPGFKVLDMGCGPGRHTCGIYQFQGVTAVGADLAFHDLKEAANRLSYHDRLGIHGGGTWALSLADIKSIPFMDESFDIVICSEVLEHIIEDDKAIRELSRVLKNNGHLAVSVPRYWPEKICWKLSDDYFNANQGHVRIYKRKELIGLIKKHAPVNFLSYHHAHSIHAPFWWLKCLVGPNRKDSLPVNLYHRLLVWDLMKKPRVTKLIDKLLNPLLGKSVVLYFQKQCPDTFS